MVCRKPDCMSCQGLATNLNNWALATRFRFTETDNTARHHTRSGGSRANPHFFKWMFRAVQVTNMLHSRIPSRTICTRYYATVPIQPSLRGLNSAVREKAEKLSRDWKGTSASGENTKNFIGGEFVQSSSTQWIDVVDPVRCLLSLSTFILILGHVAIVHTNTTLPRSGNN